jgi:hypothetical protein
MTIKLPLAERCIPVRHAGATLAVRPVAVKVQRR